MFLFVDHLAVVFNSLCAFVAMLDVCFVCKFGVKCDS